MKSIINSCLFQSSGHMHVVHITRQRWWMAILQASQAFLINSAVIPSSPGDLPLFSWSMAANTFSSSGSGSAASKSMYSDAHWLSFDLKGHYPVLYSCHLPRTSINVLPFFIYTALTSDIHGAWLFHFLNLIKKFLWVPFHICLCDFGTFIFKPFRFIFQP